MAHEHHHEHDRSHEHRHEHESEHELGHGCCEHCCHEHGGEEEDRRGRIIKLAVSAVLFVAALLCEHVFRLNGIICLVIYIAAFCVVGYEVVIDAFKGLFHGEPLDECFLMTVASVGAFFTGSYGEAAAVMILYSLGEFLQDLAVDKSRDSISELIDIVPKTATVIRSGEYIEIDADDVEIGDTLAVKPGENVPVDGVVISGKSSVNTSALTGESLPADVCEGDTVLGGYLNLTGEIRIRAEKEFDDSAASRIKGLIEGAEAKKAKTESFIKRFARVYTPVVVILALIVAVLPPLFDHQWRTWIHRALTFLVVSCPCALVISVPLTFFAGIGSASRKGILIKGAEHLETLGRADIFAFDKTGTLTKGSFSVVNTVPAGDVNDLITVAKSAEAHSNHPIAKAVSALEGETLEAEELTELPGEGIRCVINGSECAVGNAKLMRRYGIQIADGASTSVHVCRDGVYLGRIDVSDTLKKDASDAIKELKALGAKKTVMLSGDNKAAAEAAASAAGVDEVRGSLLPEDKVDAVEELLGQGSVAYTGDGINDAAVLARADVGIAMGALGSDAAIEAADVVITDDNIGKVPTAVRVSKKTVRIAWQNIVFAIAVKLAVMVLSVTGVADMMWLAVFADTGVALLCAANAMRAMK